MRQAAGKIVKFTDLEAWRSTHALRIFVCQATHKFPKDEKFGLVNQLRRASVSVASCLAEGFSRKTAKDKMHFCTMSLGSLTEAQDRLLLARDLGYIPEKEFKRLAQDSIITHKLVTGLIKSVGAGKGIKLQ